LCRFRQIMDCVISCKRKYTPCALVRDHRGVSIISSLPSFNFVAVDLLRDFKKKLPNLLNCFHNDFKNNKI
jgi:hypothetical protein